MGLSLKNNNKIAKLGLEIRLETQMRNLRQQERDDNREEKYEMLGQSGKSITTTTKDTTRRDKSEDNGKRRKSKKIMRQEIETKQDFLKQRKKILSASRGKSPKTVRMQRRQNDFRAKYGNGGVITKRPNG